MADKVLEARWKQLHSQGKKWWGKLSDDELKKIGNNVDRLSTALQERYGYTKDQADQEIARRLK
jgi:uncharacterized protein YjbJ (UPF0337 family)